MPRPTSHVRRWPQIAALMLGVLPLAACAADLPATTLQPDGTHAQRIYDLLVPLLWAGLGVFVVVEGILLYTVFRFRRQENAGIPAQVHGNTRIEVMWTIFPALIVLLIAILTFRTQAANAVQPPDALQITAIGHQWWYEFQYPGEGIITASDMYIPVGRDVTVTLEAKDVIHSFWVPRLAGKTDMIPGLTNRLSFLAEQPGVYYAHCSVLCGESHANMAFRVIAVPQETYNRWVTEFKQNPATTGDAERGALVFEQKVCWSCHIINGHPTAERSGNNAPNLTHYGSRTTIAAGVLPYSKENLAKWLHDPGTIKPGNLMAALVRPGYLNDQEIADLVAYLDGQKLSIETPSLAGK